MKEQHKNREAHNSERHDSNRENNREQKVSGIEGQEKSSQQKRQTQGNDQLQHGAGGKQNKRRNRGLLL